MWPSRMRENRTCGWGEGALTMPAEIACGSARYGLHETAGKVNNLPDCSLCGAKNTVHPWPGKMINLSEIYELRGDDSNKDLNIYMTVIG